MLAEVSAPLAGEVASGTGPVGAGETGFALTVAVDFFDDVFLTDWVPAKLTMASDMPIPQSMTAIKMRGLNIPDLEDGFLFIDEWVVDCLLPYRRLGFCTVDGELVV